MRKCLHQGDLWVFWLLIARGGPTLLWVAPFPGWVVLNCSKWWKLEEYKQVRVNPFASWLRMCCDQLLELLLWLALSDGLWSGVTVTLTWNCKSNKPFLPYAAFGHGVFYWSNRSETRTPLLKQLRGRRAGLSLISVGGDASVPIFWTNNKNC